MSELVEAKEKPLAVYDEVRGQLVALQELNEKTIFDYEDKKGNEEARSHVYKLRQSKSAVEKARVKEKATSLAYGRKVDSQAKDIASGIEKMILVHQVCLDEIARREKDRIEAHNQTIAAIINIDLGDDSASIQKAINHIQEIVIDDVWEEFIADAAKAKDSTLFNLRERLGARLKFETEQAELARLRQENIDREKREYEERIAKEAADTVKREAEAEAERVKKVADDKIKAEREASERRELDLKLSAERAEREKQEAIDRAARTEKESAARSVAAVEQSEREALAIKVKEEQDAIKREADKKHKAKINNRALQDLVDNVPGLGRVNAKLVVEAIAKKLISSTSIGY